MGVIANKAVIVERELNNAKRNKNDFYSWFYVSEDPYKEFLTAVRNNPNTWRPTIYDVINEIANYYGDSFEEYQAISDYLTEVNNNEKR